MQRKLLLIVCLLWGWRLQAQVVITLQLPPLGLTIKPQLWNMSLINTTGGSMTTQLQMVMTDAGTGQTVLTATTAMIQLQPGAQAITASNVGPLTYTVGAGYTVDGNPNGFLPVGVFNICYTLTRVTNHVTDAIADECVTAEVEPISPPQLLVPGDSDRVLSGRPMFTWLPPTPHNLFNNLVYDLVLVEVQATQSGADAIQQNVPLLLQSNISFTSLQYPLSLTALDTGKLYAWRVTAKNNLSPIANSEVWCFRLEQSTNDTTHSAGKGYYAHLRREQDASYIITGSTLRFMYQHELNSASVQLKITDISKNPQQVVQFDSSNLAVKYGSNYLSLDLSSNGLTDRHIYLLELTNDRNEHWYLKFEYRKQQEQ